MRYTAHREVVFQIVEPVGVFQNQPEAAHQCRFFEIFLQVRIKLGHEKRVVIGQSGDKSRIDREITLFPVAGSASTAVAAEGLVEEDLPAFFNQRRIGRGGMRRLHQGKQDQQE